ncbi:MAG: AbrB/MazE/SpoVT family DNA-binding domain-containing protein [Candidatus Altiarchaeales archaeon]|nr:AbrB/MazE/SpoVT family DNA-binding domain-containing protein [Candidatus Altiarchaeota archaeon]MBU4341842.1 AbrB/MazE/SpoVT family DNA-binding domain-containing protein [Candidatus Altiarchaeota archaeon]MBU4406288.1 AbrB/MazE/SpoVT family DNA-binding domain-containing protein [Candidatus Altiarchaeota archaeon]MBU4437706.1 AbrB/MazE/SpoVT family DNA-binding domain-containing protein [Candidatus Altiarchaeota archaeon]MCG2782675.1 AbrB/MazE/SpoVT family DNA-binding domain-containing protein
MELDIVTVTSRGQIVIPKSIRNVLEIKKGERLLAYDKGDEIVLKPLRNMESKSIDMELEKVFAPAWKIAKERNISKEDVDEEIRKYRAEKNKR